MLPVRACGQTRDTGTTAGSAPRARTRRGLLLTVAVLVLTPDLALAQDRAEPPPEAVEFYRSGREHYRAGRYRQAVDDLERALTLDPGSPTLVYNLARVHELIGDLDRSIRYYEDYLRLLPEEEAEERDRVITTLQRLQGARDQVGSIPATPGPPPEVDEEREPRWVNERGVVDGAFWLVAGGSAALLVGGAVVGIIALEQEGRAQDFVLGSDGPVEERDDIADRADHLAVAADVLFLAGAAAGVTAALLYALRTRTVERFPDHRDTTAWLEIDGTSAVVGVRGSL